MKEATMSKQTSIEWFAQKDTELTIQFLEGKLNQIQLAIEKMQCLNKAKQMHKEEIEDAFNNGMSNSEDYFTDGKTEESENYYQETYGGNNE